MFKEEAKDRGADGALRSPRIMYVLAVSAILIAVSIGCFVIADSDTSVAEVYSGNCGDNLTWSYDSGTKVLTIDGTGEMEDYSSLSSVPWNDWRDSIEKVIIGDSVTSISGSAFRYCDALTSVTIPNSVTSIGEYAFLYCTSLTSASIPDSVTSMGEGAFHECWSLESVEIPDSITSIRKGVFYNCRSLTSVTIPDSVTSIEYEAFYYCNSLKSVTIGNSVTSIGDGAFRGCSSLTSVIIPSSVTFIRYNAFYGCNSLFEVINLSGLDIKKGVEENGYVGYYAKNVFKILKDSTVETIDGKFIVGSSEGVNYLLKYIGKETSVTLPDKVKGGDYAIYDYAFYNCKAIKSVTIPDSVTSIGYNAFYECYSLSSVTIGNSVESIGDLAFHYCESLESVEIPDSVTSIGLGAFSYCKALKSVTIGNSVESIGTNAFNHCESLESVEIPNSVESIGEYAFNCCVSLMSVTIGNSVTTIGIDAFSGCTSLESIMVIEGNTKYSSRDGVFFNGDGSKLIIYPVAKKGDTYTIPDTVIFIGNNAFSGCTSLKSVTIPNSVESIEFYAFMGCSSLESVTIGNSVESIGYGAFDGCISLTSVIIPDSVISIGNGVFNGCKSLTSVTIGKSVESIGDNAFYECTALNSIVIPASVTSIGDYAFYECVSLFEVINLSKLDIKAGSEENGYVAHYAKNVFDSVSKGTVETIDGMFIVGSSEGVNYLLRYIGEETSVTLPNKVKEGNYVIQDLAFDGCKSLTSVTIPDSVTSIGKYAFYGCESLSSLTIGNSVTTIGDGAFDGCKSITSLAIPDSVKSIGDGAFYRCNSLTSATIGNSVTTIGECAFYGCESLSSLTIGKSVESIDYEAFEGCTSLTSVVIPDSVKTIGDYAFEGCESLSSLTIGNSVTSIGDLAFEYCISLTSVTIPDSVTTIGYEAFYGCTSLISVTIGNSVTTIGDYAFEGCESIFEVINLSKLGIEVRSEENGYVAHYAKNVFDSVSKGTVETIDGKFIVGKSGDVNYLLRYIGEETSVILPDKVKEGNYVIQDSAFENTSIESVVIPDSVTSIGDRAFAACVSLTSVTLGKSVTYIGDYAFFRCVSLSTVIVSCENELPIKPGTKDNGYLAYHASEVKEKHDYSPKFEWAEEGSNCTVTLTCGCGHTETLPADVTVAERISVTCMSAGKITFEASVIHDGVTYTDSKIFDSPALGHDYSITYEWSDDGRACIVHIECKNDPSHKHDINAIATSSKIKDSTYDEMGVTRYSVSGEYEGFSYSSTKDVTDIPKKVRPVADQDGKHVVESEHHIASFDADTITGMREQAHSNSAATLSVSLKEGTIVFDSTAMKKFGNSGSDLALNKLSKEHLTEDVKKIVGDNAVFRITFGDNKKFEGGKVTVTVPYELGEGMDPDHLVIYYIADGEVVEKIQCEYKDGKVTFVTDHFSIYAVMHEKPEPSGSGFPIWIIPVIIAVAAAGAGAFIFIMKKKA